MLKTVVGIDFGTESGRAVLVDVHSGAMLAHHVSPYPHGVMSDSLPTGEPLGDDWALQHPDDYIHVLKTSVSTVIEKSGVTPDTVIGIGIDFTSCTMLPVDGDGTPLCVLREFRHRPHSWPKLWKHHAAKGEADDATRVAQIRQEGFLQLYGGAISSEWMIPKILQVLRQDAEIYRAADRFVEAGDWVVSQMTGNLVRSRSAAGFKSMWTEAGGPSREYFASLHPDLENIMTTKLRGNVVAVGATAGYLTDSMAADMGVSSSIPVATAAIDAFAAVPGAGVVDAGSMVLAMGTSTCHMVLSDEMHSVPGITGVVRDGILPGFYGYEAGQASVGDTFRWFLDNAVPDSYWEQARTMGIHVYDLLEQKAREIQPGESGLVALDWWNGNRSILGDARLSGVFVGLTLNTKPEEMYRALIEATAFGTRKIIERFVESGIEINELVACGGLPLRNQMLMQVYADITGRPIRTPRTEELTALGAAMLGAAAAGKQAGGYASVADAVRNMSPRDSVMFYPCQPDVQVYDDLYRVYCGLHDIFGDESRELMYALRSIRETARGVS